ncbi:Endothelin-converting enzyme 1-like isoform X2 [Aphelenchoides bicaudatus]|nr:Endothelin-converting enzyme 1-like isoform X2 [Aphelenchoides bicaudatus]
MENVMKKIEECQANAILDKNATESHAIKQMRLYRDSFIRFQITGCNFNDLELTDEERKELVQEIQIMFPLVADHLFVVHCIEKEHLNEVKEIAESIKASFHQLLKQQKWFDRQSLISALQKNSRTQIVVGASSKTMDLKVLDHLYSNLHLEARDSLYEMQYKLQQVDLNDEEFYGSVNDARSTTMNAFNYRDENVVFVPAGILFSPNFLFESSLATKYGSIGSVIGHELAHNYGLGKRILLYCQERRRQVVVEMDSPKVQTSCQVFDERIRSIGVQVAYRAYQKRRKQLLNTVKYSSSSNFTNSQEFFISFATHWCFITSNNFKPTDSHSSIQSRINVPMKSFPRFANAFKCPLGSQMNSPNKCLFFL